VAGGAQGRRYVRFLGLALGIVAALIGIGWLPTRRVGGAEAPVAMVAGCAISLMGAAVAGWLLIAVSPKTPEARMQAAFLAMVVRLIVVAVLGLAAVVAGTFERTPLLFWLAVAYIALLPLEVKLAIESE
jgi:hypothetical protein